MSAPVSTPPRPPSTMVHSSTKNWLSAWSAPLRPYSAIGVTSNANATAPGGTSPTATVALASGAPVAASNSRPRVSVASPAGYSEAASASAMIPTSAAKRPVQPCTMSTPAASYERTRPNARKASETSAPAVAPSSSAATGGTTYVVAAPTTTAPASAARCTSRRRNVCSPPQHLESVSAAPTDASMASTVLSTARYCVPCGANAALNDGNSATSSAVPSSAKVPPA
mmetsp:Transcript_39390/g.96424  ORF Transcript_39390/g.96424 Transcript_39390/m.96424 type:complete len:227 (+) Transcript_39390:240-920(+)